MKSITQFLSEVRIELTKVEWPQFNEFMGATAVTLFLVIVFSLFFGAIDKLISLVIKYIFTYSI